MAPTRGALVNGCGLPVRFVVLGHGVFEFGRLPTRPGQVFHRLGHSGVTWMPGCRRADQGPPHTMGAEKGRKNVESSERNRADLVVTL
eukprot:234636-Rhodomonas_salina.1